MRIGIAGIRGRLGRLCAEELRARGLNLSGGLSRQADPSQSIVPDARLLAKRSKVVIDVSHADLVMAHAEAFTAAGCAWVIGTTGFNGEASAAISAASRHIPVLQAANFSPALTILLDIVQKLGAALPAAHYDADVTDMHHRQKIDAPSGTAKAIGTALAQGRGVNLGDVKRIDPSGARESGQIGFASLRSGQIVGDHSAIFTSGDEQITVSHRVFDRRVFARGAVDAAIWLQGQPPGLYTMNNLFT